MRETVRWNHGWTLTDDLKYIDFMAKSGGTTMHTIDLDKLPEFAQCELQDFYQFLLQKYAEPFPQTEAAEKALASRLVKPFEPISREAVYER